MFSIKRPAALALLVCGLSAHAEPTTPHLSLDDIDQMSRARIARQMSGESAGVQGPSASTMSAPQPAIAASAPMPTKVVAAPVVKAAEPVNFVGAYADASGSYVLYSYRNAVYPARIGTKLLNGWSTKKVDGYLVTVSDGKRSWTEPITSASATVSSNSPLRSLVDLGGPLPPGGFPPAGAQPAIQIER
ncbi:hypothetical protein [Paraburkholderia sp. BL10I2N1]|uniref:hypothetical protein n=1 Tax=Paraburkholderia sp. BL10I2N1 TaxID=1938796 RepID=UPI00105C9FD1|nr:hypothetical protein [Paraburkholderia sp. BL10I2N1]TDN59094.1 hypothetical protein B0G77_8283 [Paraburkholderia sp. BL10I2N1]